MATDISGCELDTTRHDMSCRVEPSGIWALVSNSVCPSLRWSLTRQGRRNIYRSHSTSPTVYNAAETFNRRCDNYNLKSHRRCYDMSRMNLSEYIGHVTIFSWMFTITCCLVLGLGLGLGFRIRFSVWLVSCYARVFVRLWVVIVTDRFNTAPSNKPSSLTT